MSGSDFAEHMLFVEFHRLEILFHHGTLPLPSLFTFDIISSCDVQTDDLGCASCTPLTATSDKTILHG
jgi:uncharacterized protein (DUF111 family)